jgi:hypothetical protein
MCLIGPVLSLGATFVGFASALLAYLYVLFTDPAYNKDGTFTPVILAFSFLIGLQICNIFTVPISSGIDTIVSRNYNYILDAFLSPVKFVASAWDPDVLQRDHPDLYAVCSFSSPNDLIRSIDTPIANDQSLSSARTSNSCLEYYRASCFHL